MASESSAPTEQPISPRRSLITKLCEVMESVERIPKSGFNSFLNFAYVTESDLADAIRGELAKRKIFILPNVTDVKRTPHEVETKAGIRKTQLTEIMVQWTFIDGESGESQTIYIPGVGEDNVDKGFYKAFTGSEKYMLMKTFLVPTGDDPERESKTDSYDARERQKAIVDAQKKKHGLPPSVPPHDETLWLSELDGGIVQLEGEGLAMLRAEIAPEKAKELGIKKRKTPEGDIVVMPQGKVFDLEAVCNRSSIKMHWKVQLKEAKEKEATKT